MINNNIGYIAPSELIITPRGSIYHLNITPEQLAHTVITVGDPDRVGQISKYFDRVEYKTQHREFVIHTGYVGSKRLSVISTGIGPDNIDIVMNELDALVNIDFNTRTVKDTKTSLSVIRMGTCGGLPPELPVDSLVVSSHGIGLDNVLHYYKYTNNTDEQYILTDFQNHTGMKGAPVLPYIAEGSIALRKHFVQGYIHGITVTCPGFYGPQGRMVRAGIAYPNLLDAFTSFSSRDLRIMNFEMETSAIYGLGKILGHHCMSVNAVINNRAHKVFSADAGKAIEHMIKHSLEIIEHI